MGDSYEKRARAKRKAQKKREKAEQKRRAKEEGTGETASEEDIAARYIDPPEDEDEG